MSTGVKAKTTKDIEQAGAKALKVATKKTNKKTGVKVGRKAGGKNKATLQKQETQQILREEFTAIVRPHLGEILRGQLELAKGAYITRDHIDPETGEVQEIFVYKKEPSQKAGEYLLNQVIGKPKDRVEIEGEIRTLVDVIRDLEQDDE